MSTLWERFATEKPTNGQSCWVRLASLDPVKAFYSTSPEWFHTVTDPITAPLTPRIYPGWQVISWRPTGDDDGDAWTLLQTNTPNDADTVWVPASWPSTLAVTATWDDPNGRYIVNGQALDAGHSQLLPWLPR